MTGVYKEGPATQRHHSSNFGGLTPESNDIKLDVRPSEDSNKIAKMEVEDIGVGMPPSIEDELLPRETSKFGTSTENSHHLVRSPLFEDNDNNQPSNNI